MKTRSVVIIDTPENCMECPCLRKDKYMGVYGVYGFQCMLKLITFGLQDDDWIYDRRPDWCPMVPLQE